MSLTTPINATSNQQEFTVVKRLSKARFPVYLAKSTTSEKSFALKVYPFEEGKVSKFFLNECHFIDLNHPNIITIYQTQKEKNSVSKGKQSKISYILMEYAPYGDFYDLIITKRIQFDREAC
jgi:Protein kinase domain.